MARVISNACARPRLLPWLLGLTLVAGAAACAEGPQDAPPPYPQPKLLMQGPVIAQVGPVAFHTQEMEHRINAQSPFLRERFNDLDKRRKFVTNEVRFELLAQEAWRRGMPSDPQVIAELKKILVQRLVRQETERLSQAIDVTEAELRTAFVNRRDEYNKPEKIRLSQIVRYVDSEKVRAAATRALEEVKAKVLAGEKKNQASIFPKMARVHSEDEATKRSGGDLQFLTREQLQTRYGADVAKSLFDDLAIGDSVVAHADNAVVLFKKTGRRRGVERSLEQVKPQLRGKLMNEKRAAAFEALVVALEGKHGIRVDDAALEQIVIDMTAPSGNEPSVVRGAP